MLKIPAPNFGELAGGHFGRFRRANGFDENEAIAKLCSHLDFPKQRANVLRALAITSQKDVSTYFADHSLVYFNHPAPKDDPATFLNVISEKALVRRSGLSQDIGGAKFCWLCRDDDQNTIGYAYWRRNHQIPGVERCMTHGVLLERVELQDAFESSPSWKGISLETQYNSSIDYSRYPALGRYERLAIIFSQLPSRHNSAVVHSAFHARAADIGLRLTMAGDGYNLSDLMKAEFPVDWINRQFQFPPLIKKKRGDFYHAIDAITTSKLPRTAVTYCAALAVMFDSVDDAVAAFFEDYQLNSGFKSIQIRASNIFPESAFLSSEISSQISRHFFRGEENFQKLQREITEPLSLSILKVIDARPISLNSLIQNAPDDRQIDIERLFRMLHRNGLVEPVMDTKISDKNFITTELGNSFLDIMRALNCWMMRSYDEISEARSHFDNAFEVVEIEN